jgi:hypothetical protein
MNNLPKPLGSRVDLYDKVVDSTYLKDVGESCESGNALGNVKLMNFFGSDSAYGQVRKGCVASGPMNEDCSCSTCSLLAVKIIPLDKELHLLYFQNQPKDYIENSIHAELTVLDLCTEIARQKICPNVPITYSYHLCQEKQCTLQDKQARVFRRVQQPRFKKEACIYVLCEYASLGDIGNWLDNNINQWIGNATEIFCNAFFQVLAGLHYLQSHFGISHNDLHTGNVLVFPCEAGGFFEYKIDNVIYHVPNLGLQFVLWDFGAVNAPPVIASKDKDWYLVNRHAHMDRIGSTNDYNFLFRSVADIVIYHTTRKRVRAPVIINDLRQKFQALSNAKKEPGDVIKSVFLRYFTPNDNNKICERYDLDKKVELQNDLAFLSHMSKETRINYIKAELPTVTELFDGVVMPITNESFVKIPLDMFSPFVDVIFNKISQNYISRRSFLRIKPYSSAIRKLLQSLVVLKQRCVEGTGPMSLEEFNDLLATAVLSLMDLPDFTKFISVIPPPQNIQTPVDSPVDPPVTSLVLSIVPPPMDQDNEDDLLTPQGTIREPDIAVQDMRMETESKIRDFQHNLRFVLSDMDDQTIAKLSSIQSTQLTRFVQTWNQNANVQYTNSEKIRVTEEDFPYKIIEQLSNLRKSAIQFNQPINVETFNSTLARTTNETTTS